MLGLSLSRGELSALVVASGYLLHMASDVREAPRLKAVIGERQSYLCWVNDQEPQSECVVARTPKTRPLNDNNLGRKKTNRSNDPPTSIEGGRKQETMCRCIYLYYKSYRIRESTSFFNQRYRCSTTHGINEV